MKAEHLRIGNWVLHEPKNARAETQVDAHDLENLQFYHDKYGNEYQPIPLTEEWLERFGIMQNTWFEDRSYMIKEDRGFGWDIYVQNAANTKKISFAYFKHVHQLQNLYFALTGEELQTDETEKKVN